MKKFVLQVSFHLVANWSNFGSTCIAKIRSLVLLLFIVVFKFLVWTNLVSQSSFPHLIYAEVTKKTFFVKSLRFAYLYRWPTGIREKNCCLIDYCRASFQLGLDWSQFYPLHYSIGAWERTSSFIISAAIHFCDQNSLFMCHIGVFWRKV